MAAIAVDINDMVGVNIAALRVLNDNLGNAATTAFLKQYEKTHGRSDTEHKRPHLTAAQIADALECGKAESARLNASVGGGYGNFTEDRHKFPQMTNDEVFDGIMRIQAEKALQGATI